MSIFIISSGDFLIGKYLLTMFFHLYTVTLQVDFTIICKHSLTVLHSCSVLTPILNSISLHKKKTLAWHLVELWFLHKTFLKLKFPFTFPRVLPSVSFIVIRVKFVNITCSPFLINDVDYFV